MIGALAKQIFGTKNERDIKRMLPLVQQVNSLEPSFRKLSDADLKAKAAEFRRKIKNGASLESMLPETFAMVREAALRILGMRPFDVQVLGGIVLHEGKIAEMKTGEGKTLVATMPVVLNALSGKGVHLVTVNDYLAARDAEWMGRVYGFLGLSTGVIIHGLNDKQRRDAYNCDITYGTNNEFGFDYLRDNMKFRIEQYAQRELNFAIIDEVDSILIDEARTPLIISGPTEDSTEKYFIVNQVVSQLKPDHYDIDEEARSIHISEAGIARVEQLMKIENLYDPRFIEILHHVNQALKAHFIFHRDKDYVVKDGEVIIVDEFTGRLMPGRRYSDGLHQAIEAKEKVKIENENQTLASITFQNYFRMYNKLAGMTGTADTEAEEFGNIYKLEVIVMPTNRPLARIDNDDMIYRNERGKFNAIVDDILEKHEEGRPCLVGTVSIEKSELLSNFLKKKGIRHNVLNAKQHEKEAEIIKDAGQPGAVTIATNMAGRGTDIVLGPGVAKKGGLHIIGTERHESRRIDNQLRGRSGRQGDKGSSRFYLSLEDELMKRFANQKMAMYMEKLGMEEDIPIEHRWVSKAIEGAQKRVEARNFDIRKQLLKYDDVMNHQRKIIYSLRREILEKDDIQNLILEDCKEILEDMVFNLCPSGRPQEEWEFDRLADSIFQYFDVRLSPDLAEMGDTRFKQETLLPALIERIESRYREKEAEFGNELMRSLEKEIKLRTVDTLWKDHLLSMDQLKEEVGFEGYAQRDPLLVYQKRGFELFSDLVFRIKEETVGRLFKIQLREDQPKEAVIEKRKPQEMHMSRGDAQAQKTVKRSDKKVGRNDPCPCGSGKKYKKCHGA